MLLEADFTCSYCGSLNAISVDASGGRHQSYTEDCQICCRPNVLTIAIEWEDEQALVSVEAEQESEGS